MTLRVACLQVPMTEHPKGSPNPVADRSANLAGLDRIATEAAGGGARLLITPEISLTGYTLPSAAIAALAEPADGPAASAVADIARRRGIAVLYGYPERGPDGEVFNAVQLIDRDGARLANYRKTHLLRG